PPAMIGAGKSVRCARCRTVWYVGGSQTPATPPPSAATAAGAAHPAPTVAPPTVAVEAEHPAAAESPAPPPSPEPVAPPAPPLPEPMAIAATTELVPISRGELAGEAEVAPPDDTAMADLMSEVRGRRRRMAPVLAAWVLSLAVVGGGLAAAYKYRGDVMDAWPASQRVYAALGIAR